MSKKKQDSVLRIHFQSNPEAPMVFQVNQERYQAAVKRNAHIAHQVESTIGTNLDDLYAILGEVNVLVGWVFPQKDLAKLAPNLKWIHAWGAGIEHLLPLDWLPPGVDLTNNSGVHGAKAREYMIMAILMLSNQIPTLVNSQQKSQWNELFNTSIAGKTLSIIGVGQMGASAAQEAKRFGMRVIGVRRSGQPHPDVDEMVSPEKLDYALSQADIVLITTPLTAKTKGMIGRRELDLLKPGAGFINLGRASVVDYEALADKLEKGEISGAILDVFDPEPLPSTSRLWTTPNLIMTPHVASDDAEQYIPRTLDLVFENVRRYFANSPLKNRVNPQFEY
ncbi:MAG: D-2-hydroxyacid dehydrogenase [Chloroflexi bacterium]|nr:D-2-hydroxyacid dehydrogenase [Chloroflexota bacterium]